MARSCDWPPISCAFLRPFFVPRVHRCAQRFPLKASWWWRWWPHGQSTQGGARTSQHCEQRVTDMTTRGSRYSTINERKRKDKESLWMIRKERTRVRATRGNLWREFKTARLSIWKLLEVGQRLMAVESNRLGPDALVVRSCARGLSVVYVALCLLFLVLPDLGVSSSLHTQAFHDWHKID